MYYALIQNIALLVALTFVHSLLVRRMSAHRLLPLVSGLLFGAVALIAMKTPLVLQPGLIFDGRSIILAVAGLFGGPVVALIAASVASAYRFWLGGVGAHMGVAVIVGASGIGVLWHYLRRRRPSVVRLHALYLFGLLVHVWMILCMSFLPAELARQVLSNISLPVLLLYPPATLLVCVLFLQMEQHVAAEKRLEYERGYLNTILQTIPDLLFELGLDGRYYACYARHTEQLAAPIDELLGKTVSEVMPADAAEVCLEALQEAQTTGHSHGRQLCLPLPDGVHWFELAVARKTAQHAAAPRFVVLSRDITERRRVEAELLQAKEQAEAASRAKSEFLANMSHEIRTPMNGVIGMVHLLRFTELTPTQQEYLDSLQLSADNLLSLISDILDLSKIEAGKIQLEYVDFSLRKAINDVVVTQLPYIQGKHLQVQQQVADDLPQLVQGDQLRCKQILLNLLGNAIKFTEQGGITIAAEVVSASDGQVVVRLSVIDTGIGMSADVLEKIFAPFEQADSSTTRKYGGTGLGLAICRRLTDLMGGRIWAESTPGSGSRFSLELPFKVRQRQRPAAAEAVDGMISGVARSYRLLVAEDNLINAKFIQALLMRLGHRCDVVENGRQVLDRLTSQQYDCLLMDVQMPVMDGSSAMLAIRQQEQPDGCHQPIIALTAHALKGDREHFLATGFDGYLAKPIATQTLLAELHRVIGAGDVTGRY